MNVRDGMSHVVLAVGPAHTLREASRQMSARRVGAAVVTDPEHAGIGILLLTSIVVGNRVEGGTLAFQTAWVFFVAPYAILAQPVHGLADQPRGVLR